MKKVRCILHPRKNATPVLSTAVVISSSSLMVGFCKTCEERLSHSDKWDIYYSLLIYYKPLKDYPEPQFPLKWIDKEEFNV